MKYQVVDYDVLGNETDGYDVNDIYRLDLFVDLKGTETNIDIVKKMVDIGFLNEICLATDHCGYPKYVALTQDYDGSFIEFFENETYCPICRLELV